MFEFLQIASDFGLFVERIKAAVSILRPVPLLGPKKVIRTYLRFVNSGLYSVQACLHRVFIITSVAGFIRMARRVDL